MKLMCPEKGREAVFPNRAVVIPAIGLFASGGQAGRIERIGVRKLKTHKKITLHRTHVNLTKQNAAKNVSLLFNRINRSIKTQSEGKNIVLYVFVDILLFLIRSNRITINKFHFEQ